MRNLLLPLVVALMMLSCNRATSVPPADTHSLVEEVHHKPELARNIIRQVVAEHHGVTMVAEELGKNEMAATTVIDELMKQPALARAIEDRCAAATITREVERRRSNQ